jgi:branched-chain amino acid aminotransferase
MPLQKSKNIWVNGSLVDWDNAQVHVSAHALHYGSSVFEGIRAYDTGGMPAVFCLGPHVERLFNSAKVCRMDVPYTTDQMSQAIIDTVKANGHSSCYIRPLVFRGVGSLGLDPRACPVEVIIITMEWGRYLGEEAVEQGVDVGVSSWRRMAPDTFPAAAKIGGQYINSQLMTMEANNHGYAEAIALDVAGFVSEGSGENIFVVRYGEIYTPPLASSILEGVTRRCVMTLAKEAGIPVHEALIPREMLYMADEAFFTGTAVEITPIRSVDHIQVGAGRRGPVTARLQREFYGICDGSIADRFGWLTPTA